MLSNYPPLVDIQFVQQSINKARVFVIDSSGSMGTVSIIMFIICKVKEILLNQRTNGPENAHLISGPRQL